MTLLGIWQLFSGIRLSTRIVLGLRQWVASERRYAWTYSESSFFLMLLLHSSSRGCLVRTGAIASVRTRDFNKWQVSVVDEGGGG